MEAIIIFLLIGVGAQLVKGSMGMAYGVTSTTLLVFTGVQAATASAIVHLVEVGTTLALGLSHWKMGNVDWKLALSLGVPGAFGAFVGARVLGQASASAARPVTAAILVALGTFIVLRFIGLVTIQARTVWGPKRLGILGLVVGGLDATGGGGWGTMTTSTLMAAGKREPRRIVGTVLAAQFLVATAATLGFIPVLSREVEHHAAPALGLFIGGIITAPFAAWLAGKVNASVLGSAVGVLLVGLNVKVLFDALGVGHASQWEAIVLAAGFGMIAGNWARQYAQSREEKRSSGRLPTYNDAHSRRESSSRYPWLGVNADLRRADMIKAGGPDVTSERTSSPVSGARCP
ncbi:sulfite exporter TauE/SafE family protein [uncultured Corynebacterium sp.]|uniref:sulfite exporter TauE/SafE family protein n=1 Tax=uncultured Corynebacterium sp. TaxID=159447 RepID=UPI0025E521C6|nr:sulfite exporter TauE/SafE family protein [uncultured Corynebacterium sp.]